METLTTLEQQVIEALTNGDDFEEMATDSLEGISESTGLSFNQVKGVLGSLSKKNIIMFGEYPTGTDCYHLKNEYNKYC